MRKTGSYRVCIGGTFDRLHRGHKVLIDKAFELAGEKGEVIIGLTTDRMARIKGDILPFKERKNELLEYVKKFNKKVEIVAIDDRYGPSIEEDFDIIVVSPETLKTAIEINEKRAVAGKKPIRIVSVPTVFADDGLPIRSKRVRDGSLDRDGHILDKD